MKPFIPPAVHRDPHSGARPICLAAATTALAILSACAAPPIQPPAASVPLAAAFAQAGPAAAAVQVSDGAWWAGYDDPTLTTLVEQSLIANQDVAIALQRVAQARAGSDAQGSRLWPTVGVQASASRSDSGLPSPVKQGMPDTRALRAGVDVAWEIDLAGGVRAARDAAQAEAAAAAAGVEGARLLVASEVARQYFLLRGAEQRLRIVQDLAAAQRETAVRVGSRLREGEASAFDLDRARAEADALDAQLPPLRMLAGISQTRLAVLLGRSPSARVVGDNAGFAWPAAREIGTGQPSELLRRRPDLIAAEARVAAETLRGAEARAQWWPKLFLSALLGRQDLRLNALDLAPVHFSNVALAFAAPVFNAGRIDAGIRAQSARAEEALLVWQKAVLVAVQEVEDSLLVRAQEAERAAALASTVDHRRRSLQRAHSLQREGQIDLLVLLDVQRSVLSSELALSDSRLQQVLADVQLYKALGGGFAPARAGTAMTSLAERTPQ
ncbi:efflux transporter outer membrane subunit [Aquincola sp. S2]|uniref:Efflux transporter outer membrane subunit n=1 Tax=Pseudaquabacterium terrae TaxID=2732868 RepID=A0ABX2ET74_9BURK|nr:efflux transporter outer membrane subunit [Aquabacterium terrae]NRF71634.1 efflux transporter outer membrane subunit [Aquabacterium terrae]